MKINKIKINNYKSFTNKNNVLYVEPDITTIIGKNESGKSNLLEAISIIPFKNTNAQLSNKVNINRNDYGTSSINYEVELENRETGRISQIEYDANGEYIQGDLYEELETKIKPLLQAMIDSIRNFEFRLVGTEVTDVKKLEEYLNNEETKDYNSLKIRFLKIYDFIKVRNNQSTNLREFAKEKERYLRKYNTLIGKIPQVFYSNSTKTLKHSYTYQEVTSIFKNENSYQNSLLPVFVELVSDKLEFITAISSNVSSIKGSLKGKINKKIDELINKNINQFYTTEKIRLTMDIDTNIVYFNVETNEGSTLALSERSNGLRWLLFLFIELQHKKISNENILYIFDEPGNSLHINAQKELLMFFKDISSLGNQIIYCTHSPNLLNLEDSGIDKMRSVVKDIHGNSYIYNAVFDQKLSSDSKMETLSPILSALGYSLSNSLHPALTKTNLVVEGISDYIYIKGIIPLISDEIKKYNIIAGQGVASVVNIVNILSGWGCNYLAIFDFDNEGVTKGVNKIDPGYNKLNKNYIFFKDVTANEIELCKYNSSPYEIENMLSTDIIEKIEADNPQYAELSKRLKAELLIDSLNNGRIDLDDVTKSNFLGLIRRIKNLES